MPLSVSQPKSPLPLPGSPHPHPRTSLQEEASQTSAGSASNDYFLHLPVFPSFSPSCQYQKEEVVRATQCGRDVHPWPTPEVWLQTPHWVLGCPLLPWSKKVKILTFSDFLLFSVSLIILINPLPIHLKSAWPVYILLDLLALTPVSAN